MPDLLVLLVILLVVVIVWRGPKTLPQIGNMLGRGVKEARKEVAEFQKERDGKSGDQPPTSPPA
jgi:TatA/E family protein of Tat protein translocase